MKDFIKNKLRENLSNEIGGKDDIELLSILGNTSPFMDLLVQIQIDWGKHSDIYHALSSYLFKGGKNYKQVIAILMAYDLYDEYKHFLHLNENHQKGMKTACNTMSVATYKEGLNLIVNAIGTPEENPKMWSMISKPLHNWQEADLTINNQVEEDGMSGDSMVDESNTWWAAIQSTICK